MNHNQSAELKHTPLYNFHREMQAKMVPFAGYEMPVQYPEGIRSEHKHTRNHASLFDISHMGQILIEGEKASQILETLVTGDITGLKPYRQRYTLFTNEGGGIIDDLMVTSLPEGYFLVVNAACKENDYMLLQEACENRCQLSMLTNKALLGLQGPAAAGCLATFDPEIATMPFLSARQTTLSGIDCLVHRCGYTGEDGFEISVANEDAEKLARILIQHDEVESAGLGARDTLRLEAGLCLYGHDLDESTTPVEADIAWVVAQKYKRPEPDAAHFPGAPIILGQILGGVSRIRVGFKPEGRVPVREGTSIYDGNGAKVGIITSGGYGETVGGPIAMGYVNYDTSAQLCYEVEIRGRKHVLNRVDLPFIAHRYYKNTK
jgi:aminomethyltransferase